MDKIIEDNPVPKFDNLDHSQMLNSICGLVEEFCDHPDCTTFDAVKLMKAELLELKAYKMRNEVWSLYSD